MSSEPHLPGYSVDDDDDPHGESLTSEPDSADDVILVASSAGAGDVIRAANTNVSPSTQPVPTQPTPAPPSQQQTEERGETITTTITNDVTTTTGTPLATSTATTPPLPEQSAVDDFADPKIASLHAIFPDYDAALLYSVVDSVGGDQDRAVDALLAMSDPAHVPTQPAVAHEPSAHEQTQLDEEFARQLLLEDEQQYAREQIALRQQQQQQQFPYAQRTNAPAQYNVPSNGITAQQQQPPPQRDTMSDVQEQFSKLAETSKRTFTSLMSKVKAKVQEFDQTRHAPNSSSSGSTTGTGPAAEPPSPVLDRHAQQAYYAPIVVQSPGSGGDNFPLDSPLPPSSVERDPSGVPPGPASTGGRPVSNIDPGKIGLLPKRPVSLANAESQPSRAHDDDEEELEYVENPFEEGKYS